MKLKNSLLLVALAAALLVQTGCIFSPDKGDDPPPSDGLPVAITKEILMENFRAIYEGMMINEFQDMLHPSYKTMLLAETQTQFAFELDYFDRTTEVNIHTKMFGGDAGRDADGNIVQPIDSITVSLLDQLVDWVPIPQNDIDFGGYGGSWAPFQVTIDFYNADRSHRYEVKQQVDFYVTTVEQNNQSVYKMLGQRGHAVQAPS